jgi:NADPH-dependent 7-cyano-7-deazaguanine reductase QueF-like protein
MAKLGVLEPAFVDVDGEPVDYEGSLVDSADLVQVILGNATQVFNNLNESKDFYLFLKSINGYFFASIIQNHNNYINSDKRFVNYNQKKIKSAGKVGNKEIIKLELWKYYNPKGPPLTC